VAELRDAGLLTIGTDAEGRETSTLTAAGAQVGRLLAMSGDHGQAVLDALLDAAAET
jgi:hypothetical protein